MQLPVMDLLARIFSSLQRRKQIILRNPLIEKYLQCFLGETARLIFKGRYWVRKRNWPRMLHAPTQHLQEGSRWDGNYQYRKGCAGS